MNINHLTVKLLIWNYKCNNERFPANTMSLIRFYKISILSILIDNNHVKTTNIIPIIPIIIII